MGLFADAFDKLLGAVAGKRAVLLGDKLDAADRTLPAPLEKAVTGLLEEWRSAGDLRRLWTGDARLWTGPMKPDGSAGSASWTSNVGGWVNSNGSPRRCAGWNTRTSCCLEWAGRALARRFWPTRLDGSPAVPFWCWTRPIRRKSAAIESRIDPARTLFIVSSKSGTTLEPNILQQYFFERVKAAVGAEQAGSRFIAITDPGSKLQDTAKRDRFATSHSASRTLAAAIRCCRISAWSRRLPWVSTSADS